MQNRLLFVQPSLFLFFPNISPCNTARTLLNLPPASFAQVIKLPRIIPPLPTRYPFYFDVLYIVTRKRAPPVFVGGSRTCSLSPLRFNEPSFFWHTSRPPPVCTACRGLPATCDFLPCCRPFQPSQWVNGLLYQPAPAIRLQCHHMTSTPAPPVCHA